MRGEIMIRRYSAVLFVLFLFVSPAFINAAEPDLPRPSPSQLAWQDAELMAVFHYDLHVFDGKKYVQRENRVTPVDDYNIFNPEKLDTDQWIRAVKAMGAKAAVLTVSHETGFSLYQSDVNPYCLKALKWRDGKGDIVADFVASCRKYGLEPGLYIGIRWNSYYGVHDFMAVTGKAFGKNRQDYYNRYVEKMIEELCTRYGPLFEIWFDGGAYGPELGGPDVRPIVEKYQPDCIFYHNYERADYRWGGSESGTVPYPCWSTFPYPAWMQHRDEKPDLALIKYGDPGGKYWMPAMSDAPLRGYNGRHEWFWEPGDEEHIFPLENLVDMYYKSVGRNSTLFLGITPDADGLVPDADVRRLKEFGDEITRRFSSPLAAAKGQGKELVLDLGSERELNHVVLMEDIAEGERVRDFTVEAMVGGKWTALVEGSCIGHKFIGHFDTVRAQKLRLLVRQSAAEPLIRDFSVYNVEE